MAGRAIQLLLQPVCLYLKNTEVLPRDQDLTFSHVTVHSLLDSLGLFRILKLKVLLLWTKLVNALQGQLLGLIQTFHSALLTLPL